ncbi:hypothetical protein P3T23_000608 [Paraburkholderia sp. GAS448]|uniref:hypothetical protein n=1 Tax=Paraburkholderia sp. GAS448 TaxID=3035136 RepID=UPI003D1D2BF2
MSLGSNVVCVREHMGWEHPEFLYRFVPAGASEAERRRYRDSLYSLEARKQRTSWILTRMLPVLRISADTLQSDDLTGQTPDGLTALRERYAGPPMDPLTVLVNRLCDGAIPTPDEYETAMAQATKAGQQERVTRLLEGIPAERDKWLREAKARRVNHRRSHL